MSDNREQQIKDLEKRISAARESPAEVSKKDNKYSYSGATPIRIVVELIAGIVVGSAIGYLVDGLFDTKPLFFIIFMFLGVAGSVLNIYKLADNSKEKDEV